MSNSSEQTIKQLLDAIGSRPADNSEQIEAVEYDWRKPHCFTKVQTAKLEYFIDTVTQYCSQTFTKFYQSDFLVSAASTTLHFSDEFLDAEASINEYYISFGQEDETFGLISIPTQTAISWTTQLLDGIDADENAARDLTQLEQSLLLDLASNIVKAFSDSHEVFKLKAADEFIKGQMPLRLRKGQELCKICFDVKRNDSENSSQAYFLVLCDQLLPVTGENEEKNTDIADDVIKKAMLNHVLEMNVTGTVQLASATFAFEDIMSLQVNDVLLLDQPLNDAIPLIVEDKTILYGRPVRCESRNSILISELAEA